MTRRHLLLPIAFILVAAIPRLLPHAPNVAPIAAMALFGGAYLPRRYAFLFPLVALFVTDAIIGFYAFGTMLTVYASFALSGLIGVWIGRQVTVKRVAFGTLAASAQFFLFSNFAGWLFGHGQLFPQTWHGLTGTYIAAIPFFRNTLIGDALYVTAIFGLYHLAVLAWERRLHSAATPRLQ